MKIDLHTHILPRDLPDLSARYGRPGLIRLEHHRPCCARMMIGDRVFREITDNSWDPERRLEDCDRDGVDVQVLSTVPVLFGYDLPPDQGHDLARLLNDPIADLVRLHPHRFAGFGTLPLQDPEMACRELDRCVDELGFPGFQIGTNVNGRNLDHPDLFPVLARAEERGVCVFVHPWAMFGADRLQSYFLAWLVGMPAETSLAICSLIFGGVLDRLPKLRIGFAHGGGSFPGTVARVEKGYHARPDLCQIHGAKNPQSYLGSFYLDTLVHDPRALQVLLERIGEEKLALGSDYPYPLGEDHPGRMIESMSELSPATRARLLAGTALEFLGYDEQQFKRAGAKGSS
ncbi:MAG: amidohydrolase family protein [Planctomycetota bacterium]